MYPPKYIKVTLQSESEYSLQTNLTLEGAYTIKYNNTAPGSKEIGAIQGVSFEAYREEPRG